MKKTVLTFGLILGVFLLFFFLPQLFPGLVQAKASGLAGAGIEALLMAHDYAREHVLLCLIPAFFIAGAIGNFISAGSVMRYLGAAAKRVTAYAVASVSGSVLAVCSCTVLPLFAGIYSRGAGLGPATSFLYAGPAINVLAIILTARILGPELGAARAIGAVVFSIVIGLAMHFLFRKEEHARQQEQAKAFADVAADIPPRTLKQTAVFFASLVGILVFINWGPDPASPVWQAVYNAKYWITGYFGLAMVMMLWLLFKRDELAAWGSATWGFAKQIMPLLLGGVLVAGFLLGRPGHEALIPSSRVARAVGGNGILANLFASVAGALMYFAPLTAIPIMQGLLGSGLGNGPALALLLAGPALSLPSMLVIRSILGTKKTLTFIALCGYCPRSRGCSSGPCTRSRWADRRTGPWTNCLSPSPQRLPEADLARPWRRGPGGCCRSCSRPAIWAPSRW
jgi:uncharacterized membrane protein YraQ (UPF0718 family)